MGSLYINLVVSTGIEPILLHVKEVRYRCAKKPLDFERPHTCLADVWGLDDKLFALFIQCIDEIAGGHADGATAVNDELQFFDVGGGDFTDIALGLQMFELILAIEN